MKCEKHGTEMEWRGPLTTGAMHCSTCACEVHTDHATVHIDGGKSFNPADYIVKDPGVTLGQSAGESSIYKAIADSLAQRATPDPGPATPGAPNPFRASHVYDAQARIKKAEHMLERHMHGRSADCPYCGQYASPDHTMGHNSCRDRYEADLRIASGYP